MSRRVALAALLTALVASGPGAMCVVGEFRLPDYRVAAEDPARTIYHIVGRLTRDSRVDVYSQIAASAREYRVGFVVTSIEGPGGWPTVEVHLMLRLERASISTAGSSISAYGFFDDEVEQLFAEIIHDIVLDALEVYR